MTDKRGIYRERKQGTPTRTVVGNELCFDCHERCHGLDRAKGLQEDADALLQLRCDGNLQKLQQQAENAGKDV